MKANLDEMRICDCCSGCSACASICPKNAISVVLNEEGFYYYTIDAEKCIDCGLCKKVCEQVCSEDVTSRDIRVKENEAKFKQEYYAGRNKDSDIVRVSSSGGAFAAFCQVIIDKGGCVYGVVIDYPNCEIKYKRAVTVEETLPMRGSKYIQAKLSKEIIDNLLKDVEDGVPVLFTGTSCYIKGIKNTIKMLNMSDDNIFFVDFVCAGVISAKLWRKEVEYYTKRIGRLQRVSFRDKSIGWRDFCCVFESINKKERVRFTLSYIGLLQSIDEALGISCNKCQYRSYDRPGDITVGDYWNEQFLPHKWWDDKGVSVLLINSCKGSYLLEKCRNYMELLSVEKNMVFNNRFEKLDNSINYKKRKELYDDADNMEYDQFCNKWTKISVIDRVLLGIVRPIFLKFGFHRIGKIQK